MGFLNIVVDELATAKIKIEYIGMQEYPSYSLYSFKIISSLKVSRKRLDKLESNIEKRVGYLPKVSKHDDILEITEKKAELNILKVDTIEDKLSQSEFELPFPLGNNGKRDVILDLHELPHLLVGGENGYGKTTFLKLMIDSISNAGDVKFILVDNKEHDFYSYKGACYLECPVIHDLGILVEKMEWLLNELERRYILLSNAGVPNIKAYNQQNKDKLPYLVFIMADYSYLRGRLLSDLLTNFCSRLCAKSKAAGIHLVLATEKVPVELIGKFLMSFPSYLSFKATSTIQSKIYFYNSDAVYLYYPGDAYFKRNYKSEPIRVQTYKI